MNKLLTKLILLTAIITGMTSSGAMALSAGWYLYSKDQYTGQEYYYYIKEDGTDAVGWSFIGGYWYYFAPEGEGAVTVSGMSIDADSGLVILDRGQLIGDRLYYFYPDGRMVANTYAVDIAGNLIWIDYNGYII